MARVILNQSFSMRPLTDESQLMSFYLYYIVDGGWSSWSVSKPCSVTCGSGVEILSRSCTNPAPKYGGRSCPGAGRKEQACSKNPCPSKYFWTAPRVFKKLQFHCAPHPRPLCTLVFLCLCMNVN